MRYDPAGPTLTGDTMPPPSTTANLRRLGQRAQAAIAARDDAIRAARAEGMTLREIGDAVGLSHTAIANIVNRAETKP